MTAPKVYVALSQFCEDDDSPRRVLREAGLSVRENTLARRLKREEMVCALADAEAVIAGVEPYDAEIIAALPHLRCISRCGVGTDNIDGEAASNGGIAVFNTPDEVVEPVAQLTLSMILFLARNLGLHSAAMRNGQWRRHAGFLLSEWTVGLVGFGRIGRAVEQYLRPFRPRMIVSDPEVGESQLPAGVELCDLRSLLNQADIISLHANVQPAEAPLLTRETISCMKPGSRLVNTARGYLVDEAALCDALKTGHVSGAALDVFQSEPYSGVLTTFPQVLCTPHVATLTKSSRRAMELRAARNVVNFLSLHATRH